MELTLEQALQKGVEAHKAGRVQDADRYYTAILKAQPKHPDANHNMGVLAVGVGKVEEALPFFKAALEAKSSIAQYWLSYIDALIKLDRKADAKVLFDQAKSKGAKGDGFDQIQKRLYPSASNGPKIQEPPSDQLQRLVDLYNQGKYQEALNQALQLQKHFPRSLNLFNIIGAANKGLGKLDEAIVAYQKALSIKSDLAEIYNNMGNALQEQGKLGEAIEAYNKALAIKPDYAEAHRNLSNIKEYTEADEQFLQVQEYYDQEDMSDDDKCHLSFALAKMYEDIGDINKFFSCLTKGNSLRKQLLNYSIDQDKSIFSNLKITQPYLLKNAFDIKENSTDPTPVFILGMPRSGTTLVEQIISSHSEVTDAGELSYVKNFGVNLSLDPTAVNTSTISEFRERYISELSKLSAKKLFVTDKMPQNFYFIPLICAAMPEAKIIHVQRNAAATCWSNFKQFFEAKGLGYCYDLKDVVEYYKLYKDLMKLWQSRYSNRIYNLNYEDLVNDQENQTRKLIDYLGLTWQDACLSPHKNKRSVRTASQQQVRQKVYKGSSDAWRKYEPYLKGAFDGLPSL